MFFSMNETAQSGRAGEARTRRNPDVLGRIPAELHRALLKGVAGRSPKHKILIHWSKIIRRELFTTTIEEFDYRDLD